MAIAHEHHVFTPTAAPSEMLAEVVDVTKVFGDKEVVKGISFGIRAKEMTIITGPSGSGKTTVLRMLGDLELPTTGHVNLFGKQLESANAAATQQAIKRRVSFVTQDPGLMEGRTVWNNLIHPNLSVMRSGFWGGRQLRQTVQERAGKLAQDFGVDYLLGSQVSELSGGERNRVALARSLVKLPELLILDEPTKGVDPDGKEHVYETLGRYQAEHGISVVMVGHDHDIARQYAHREIQIRSGELEGDISLRPVATPAPSFSVVQ